MLTAYQIEILRFYASNGASDSPYPLGAEPPPGAFPGAFDNDARNLCKLGFLAHEDPSYEITGKGREAIREYEIGIRLGMISIGHTTTIRGVVVTRWANDRFECVTMGQYSEKLIEAATNLADDDILISMIDRAEQGGRIDPGGKPSGYPIS